MPVMIYAFEIEINLQISLIEISKQFICRIFAPNAQISYDF